MESWDFLDGRSMLCSRCLRDQRRERIYDGVCGPCTGVRLPEQVRADLSDDECAWVSGLKSKPESDATDRDCRVIALFRRGLGEHEIRTEYQKSYAPVAPPAEEPTSGLWVPAAEGDMVNLLGCQCTEHRSLGIGQYGETFLIKFTTATGEDLVWFTGSGKEGKFDPQIGGTYDVRCKVKKFDAYRGHRSTVVSLCKETKRGS